MWLKNEHIILMHTTIFCYRIQINTQGVIGDKDCMDNQMMSIVMSQ